MIFYRFDKEITCSNIILSLYTLFRATSWFSLPALRVQETFNTLSFNGLERPLFLQFNEPAYGGINVIWFCWGSTSL